MNMQGYIDNLKFQLSGGLLEIELDDTALNQIMNMSLREIQRYINTTKLATIPYHKCIDLSEQKVSSVYRVYRTKGYMGNNTTQSGYDPMYMSQWQMLAGGPTRLTHFTVSDFTRFISIFRSGSATFSLYAFALCITPGSGNCHFGSSS